MNRKRKAEVHAGNAKEVKEDARCSHMDAVIHIWPFEEVM